MISYRSTSGKKSGVIAFEIKEYSIAVQFIDGTIYMYTYHSAGERAIETMKSHAINSNGLSTYIAKNDPPYESKY
jgi:hypothetical protein